MMFFHKERGFTLPLSSRAGFTLVEALVALTVLSIGLIGAYSAATSTLFLATSLKNSMIASGLAQEGTEVIRAIRDTNWFAEASFDTGLSTGTYEVEWNSVPPLTNYQDRFLYRGSGGRYKYAVTPGGVLTIFKRKITVTNPGNGQDVTVVSEVTWKERQRDRIVRTESRLFNWK